MTRHFKKDWDETRISEGLKYRARQRAWRRLHRSPMRWAWLPAAAAAAAMLALLVLNWPLDPSRATRIEKHRKPAKIVFRLPESGVRMIWVDQDREER